jgi:hypothetical protein
MGSLYPTYLVRNVYSPYLFGALGLTWSSSTFSTIYKPVSLIDDSRESVFCAPPASTECRDSRPFWKLSCYHWGLVTLSGFLRPQWLAYALVAVASILLPAYAYILRIHHSLEGIRSPSGESTGQWVIDLQYWAVPGPQQLDPGRIVGRLLARHP